MRRFLPAVGLLLLVAGCSTTHHGWTGAGAQPFDAALADCEAKAAPVSEAQRNAALESCMAEKGWTRPHG